MNSYAEAVQRFDTEIASARSQAARWGYFPVLYRAVTLTVRAEAEAGCFDDAARMERFVVGFAELYFRALDDERAGARVPGPWWHAFRAAERPGLLVLQHLLLGMNAHINFDLALTAATVAPGPAIHGLARDYDRINDILAAMIDRAEDALICHTPGLAAIDRQVGRWDERLAALGLRGVRDEAWRMARLLAATDEGAVRRALITGMEARASLVARALAADMPGPAHWVEPERGPAEAIAALMTMRPGLDPAAGA